MKTIKIIIIFVLLACRAAYGIEYNIKDFGAVENKIATSSIQKAIDACYQNGGGTVIVPVGTFITGTIILKSNINLHLETGAELRSSENLDDFLISSSRYGMIFCQDAYNVSITGEGTLNGLGTSFYESDQNHLYPEFDRKIIRQKEGYMPEGTFFTDGPLKRKQMPGIAIVFYHCNHVSIKGITIKDTPVWATRIGYCEDVLIDGISILNNLMIPNSDGIHLTVSRNVRIANCDIRAGDDDIVVTGFTRTEDTPGFNSKEQDKYIHGNKTIYAENIQVNNCHLQSRSSAIRIGYGQHPIRRCIFSNIVISESNRGIGIYARDSSSIEELIFSNIMIETRLYNGQWWGHGEPIHLSAITRFEGKPVGQIKNVQFNNIISTGEQGIFIYGQKESHLENIQFNNVQLHLRKGRETMGYGGNFDLRPAANIEDQIFEHDIPGIYAQYVDNIAIRDFTLSWGDDLPGFFTNGIECFEVKDLVLKDFVGGPNPNALKSQKVKLTDTTFRKID
ncbi:MAG: glycosyl hydrolase family 28 protein [Bacteroidota bacterium]|nr:glycosyl hydrolase family 28 protein [Bacteroidota bacterium]